MAPPQVRFSLRWKIAIPFMLLAMALGFGVVTLMGRNLSGGAQERLARQLAGSGQQAVDSVVLMESELLRLSRLVSNTEGGVEGVVGRRQDGQRGLAELGIPRVPRADRGREHVEIGRLPRRSADRRHADALDGWGCGGCAAYGQCDKQGNGGE
jgi:hypothetical protein